MTRFCVALLLDVAALGFTVAHAADTPGSGQGEQLFMSYNCYECHGTVGQGGAGPTIAPPQLLPQDSFAAFLRHPGDGNMPAYTAVVLSDSDLAAIYAYLAALPPPPATLPDLLSPRTGSNP